jgi:hypothetical protein
VGANIFREQHKPNRLDTCHLKQYHNEGKHFLNRIITGDEIWIHHYDPESKCQSMQWKNPASPLSKKFKTQPSARKVMLTVFWNYQGPFLEH